jgi:hypothetical protein
LWSSSLCSFLHPPNSSSLLGPSILLSTLLSNSLSLCSYINVRVQFYVLTLTLQSKFHTHTKLQIKFVLYTYFNICLETADEKPKGSELKCTKIYRFVTMVY